MREEDVAKLLQTHVVIEKDAATATQKILELPALKRYHHGLATKDEKEHFLRHLRKYVNIYLPDCPFDVCTTNRYTVITHEASVVARRQIKKGEVVKYLSGIQVAMTKKEEEELDLKNRDFSIVMSSRKKTPSLFLGPARFANHDCNANARLSTVGPHGMQIVCVRNIDIGEEITVTYGDDYFGEDNCECLCATCEKYQANGWARPIKEDSTPQDTPGPEILPGSASKSESYSLRRKRAYMFDKDTHSPIATLDFPTPPPSKRKKVEDDRLLSDLPTTESAEDAKSYLTNLCQPSPVRSSAPESSGFDPLRPQQPPKLKYRYGRLKGQSNPTSDSETGRSASPMSSIMDGSQTSSASTEATSVGEVTDVKPEILSDSELSELAEGYVLDHSKQQIVRRRQKLKKEATRQSLRNRPLPVPTVETPETSEDLDDDEDTERRRPGDYTLTRRLLSSIYSRWVECQHCEEHFVQDDAYLTRVNCPRCERHSKLYGYSWPKTDKEGRNDHEERVLDHRTVHRFVNPGEERSTKKGRKTLETLVLERERSQRESERAESVDAGRRRSRRGTS